MLDWTVKAQSPGSHVTVGTFEVSPGVIVEVEHWGEKAAYESQKPHYLLHLKAYGCTTSKSFPGKGEAKDYLRRLIEKAPLFEAVKAKRDAIDRRMAPLHKKYMATSEEIWSLFG